jgi:hypothetical protein
MTQQWSVGAGRRRSRWRLASALAAAALTPNKLVAITDRPSATALPAAESFRAISAAGFGEVLRGVSFTPGTELYGR